MGAAVILQRGRYVETAKAPKPRPFHWRYNKSFANYLGVDAEWNSDGVYRETPGCKSDRSGKTFPVYLHSINDTTFPSYLM